MKFEGLRKFTLATLAVVLLVTLGHPAEGAAVALGYLGVQGAVDATKAAK